VERELAIAAKAKGFERVSGSVKRLGGDFRTLEKHGSRAGTNIAKGLRTTLKAATLVAGGAIAVLATQLKAGSSSLQAQALVSAQTAAAIKSTGAAAKVTTTQVEALASALEDKTNIDNKTVQSGANLLLTFTRIRNETGKGNKIFDQSVEVLTDMSVAMKTDMKSGAIQLGKALNDPLKGITALTRVGVTFDASQKKRIAQFVKEGKIVEAQKIILAELNREFGGSAAAAAKAAGPLGRLDDAFETVQQTLARAFLPVVQKVAGRLDTFLRDKAVLRRIEAFGASIAGLVNDQNIGKLEQIGKGAAKALEDVDWKAIGSGLKLGGQGAKAIADAFVGAPPWVQAFLATGFVANKFSGGLVGTAISELGKGLIKGVLGMTAGVVNINAGTVTGGGAGGIPGAPGAPGGKPAPRGIRGLGGQAVRGVGWAATAAALGSVVVPPLVRAIGDSGILASNVTKEEGARRSAELTTLIAEQRAGAAAGWVQTTGITSAISTLEHAQRIGARATELAGKHLSTVTQTGYQRVTQAELGTAAEVRRKRLSTTVNVSVAPVTLNIDGRRVANAVARYASNTGDRFYDGA
jgi:hypothetical protein